MLARTAAFMIWFKNWALDYVVPMGVGHGREGNVMGEQTFGHIERRLEGSTALVRLKVTEIGVAAEQNGVVIT